MERFKTIKKYKRIIAFLAIVLLVAGIEAGFNYSALKWRYGEQNLQENIQKIKSGDYEKYVIEFADENGVYIKQVKITGEFKNDDTYWIDTTELNEFGKEVTSGTSDTVNTYFSDFYTNIDKKITRMKITIPKSEDTVLKSVSILNHFEINKYRVIFLVISLTLLYLIFFEKSVIKRIEIYFVIYALAFGMLLIACTQSRYYSWDEQIHFKTVYSLANGKNVEWTDAALDIANRTVPSCNTKAEFAELRNLMDEKGQDVLYTENKEKVGFSYLTIAYIPMVIFMKIGILLNLSFSKIFMLGKIGNLIFYVFIMYEALCFAKKKKLFLAFIAMMPTPLFLASSYSYDTIVFACVTLGCVLWYNEMTSGKTQYHLGNVIAAVLLLSVGCFSKAVYAPIILLLLLLPQFRGKGRKHQVIWIIGILAVCTLVMATFVLPALTNTISGNIAYGGDTRAGDTSMVRQLMSMLQHPWSSVKLMVGNILQMDNFRNLGRAEADSYSVGTLMFLNYGDLGVLPDKWMLLLIPMLVLLVLYEEPGKDGKQSICFWKKIFIIVGLIGIVMLIWLSMYLSFTPVGEKQIDGVQARYYLPLLYLAVILLPGKKAAFRAEYCRMAKLTLLSVNILQIAMMYEVVLKNRMF